MTNRHLDKAWLELRKVLHQADHGRVCYIPVLDEADENVVDVRDVLDYAGITSEVGLTDLLALDGVKLALVAVDGDPFDDDGARARIRVDGRVYDVTLFEHTEGDDYVRGGSQLSVQAIDGPLCR